MSSDCIILSRRTILSRAVRGAAGVLAATALTSCDSTQLSRTGKRADNIRYGLTTYQWGRNWDLPTLINNCSQAQLFGAELRTSLKYAHGVELTLNARQRSEVKKHFSDSPVTLVGLATSERFDSPDPAKLKTAIENTKAYIKLARDVGASGVRVFPNSFHEGVSREKTIEQIAGALNVVGAFAADYGRQIRLEAHGSAGELPTLKAMMDLVTEPNVRVKLNSDKRDTRGEGFEHNFNLVRDKLGSTIHVHDLQDPAFPYQLQMDLLVKIGWKGWALLERGGQPEHPVNSLIEQRQIWQRMLAESLKA
jgi:hypothetical protein